MLYLRYWKINNSVNIWSIHYSVDSHFSLVRWDSGIGETERRIAKEFPESSIFSVGSSDSIASEFVDLCEEENIKNAWRFISPLTNKTALNIQNSPELFRYQVLLLSIASYSIDSSHSYNIKRK